MKIPNLRAVLVVAVVASVAIACGDDPTGVPNSPLRGLTQAEGRDSTGTSVPVPPANATPGYFRGTVLGQAPPGAGNDSLSTMPRLEGVTVTAYPRLTGGATPEVGPAAASVQTGSDGKFQLPTLPGGDYVVTFTPPSGSAYAGVWVTATAYSGSAEYPWWVVLRKK